MDTGILSCLAAIFLPLIYGFYLLAKRVRLSFINKKILNNSSIIINLLSLSIFTILTALIIKNDYIYSLNKNIFSFDNINFNIGINLNTENALFLIFSSFIFTILAIYSKFYFEKKKQFLFTKQRYYIFLSFISFNTYMLFLSLNLIQMLCFLILEGIIIFVFSYFDIFKNCANYNITRFQRINTIGDFALLISILILFKYAVLSEEYISSTSLDFRELNILTSYTYGICNPIEFKIITAGFIITFMSRLFVFPLSCYSSFFANSSNLFFISSITIPSTIVGIFMFLKTMPFVELSAKLQDYLILLFIISAILCSIFLLFEKNFKIIYGNLISIFNSIFCTLYLIFKQKETLWIYFGITFALLFILMILFAKDKNGFNKALITKHKGYILEKIHIFSFEILPYKISKIIDFLDKKIIQNLIYIPIKLSDILISAFTIKNKRKNTTKNIRNILIIFALFAILAIFTALFGRYKC